MTNRKLENYVPVAKRIYDASPEIIRIETSAPVMLSDKMGYIRATIYMRGDRSASATATFMLGLQGQGARATNPIEDCETSAVGRALAFLGYTADERLGYSVASREEVEEAIRREMAIGKLQDTVESAVKPKSSREDLSDRMVLRIIQLIKEAEQKAVNLNHPLLNLFNDDIDQLSEAELVTLGKYISKEIESYA